MVTRRHQDIWEFLYDHLRDHVRPHGDSARCIRRQCGFKSVPASSASQILRWPASINSARRMIRFPRGQLVMEVVSGDPKDRARDLVDKRSDYASIGIPEYWIVDAETETITVLTLPAGKTCTPSTANSSRVSRPPACCCRGSPSTRRRASPRGRGKREAMDNTSPRSSCRCRCRCEPMIGAAEEHLRGWMSALRAAPRISLEFRVKYINRVFETSHTGRGSYYRDGVDRWAFQVQPQCDEPVSALEAANGQYRLIPVDLWQVISLPRRALGAERRPPQFEEYRIPPCPPMRPKTSRPKQCDRHGPSGCESRFLSSQSSIFRCRCFSWRRRSPAPVIAA